MRLAAVHEQPHHLMQPVLGRRVQVAAPLGRLEVHVGTRAQQRARRLLAAVADAREERRVEEVGPRREDTGDAPTRQGYGNVCLLGTKAAFRVACT